MPAHDFELEEALQEGVLVKWLSTIKQADEGSITVEKMVLDAQGFPQPTGELETLAADSVVLALGQDVDLSLLDKVPGLAIDNGVVKVAPNMMTGYPGIFAGGDMVPSERTVTSRWGTARRPRAISTPGFGKVYTAAAKHEIAAAENLNTCTTPTRRRPCNRCSISRGGSRTSTRCRVASTRPTRSSRRGAACRAAIA